MPKQLFLEEITTIIIYNDYIELPRDLNDIAGKIQELNITSKYRISSNTSFVISGVIPLLTIDFFENDDFKTLKYSLGLDQKNLRFSQKFSSPVPIENVETLKNWLEEFIKILSKIWAAFNAIANRSIIERVGFITIFNLNSFPIFNLLKNKPQYTFGSFRFFEIIKHNIKPFENTKIIPNAIIDPKINIKTDELISYNLISDIATTPNSKGIVKPKFIEEALNKMARVTLQNLQKIREVISSV